jgi:hypothetical protein
MTARRRPLASSVALLIVLLVGLLPSSIEAIGTPAGPVLGAVVHHHLTMPGLVRAETATHDLHADAALYTTVVAGLMLLAWAARRPTHTVLVPVAPRTPGSRDPPRVS